MLDEKLWCVITPIPVGYTEFCYIVDDIVTVSNKHPTTTDGSRNWRHIYGPPSTRSSNAGSAKLSVFQQRVTKSMDRLADSIHDFVAGRPTATASPAQGATKRNITHRFGAAKNNAKDGSNDWVTGASGESLKKLKRIKKVMHGGDKHLSDDDDDDNRGLPLHHGDARATLERGRRRITRKEKQILVTITLRMIVGFALVYVAYVCYLQIRR